VHAGESIVLKKIALVASGFAAGVTMTLATLGYHAPTVAADEAEVAHQAAIKAQVMHAIYQLDSSGFHGIEDSVNNGSVPAGALGAVQRARVMTEATDWPSDLKPMATTEIAQLKALEAALKNEDANAAKDPAHQVHENGHDLSAKAYAWLGGTPGSDSHTHGMSDDNDNDAGSGGMPGMGH